MSEYVLRSARFLADECIGSVVRAGDTVIDATMGNGHDTEKLARLVGDTGRVYAFDVQEQALVNTRERLEAAGLASRVTLLLESHARLAELVPLPARLVMFNLGWLPGGDKRITTRLDSTLQAVHAALSVLSPMGVLLMCVYPGHDEGTRELRVLDGLFASLPPQRFNCLKQSFVNAGNGAPCCFIVQKQECPTLMDPSIC